MKIFKSKSAALEWLKKNGFKHYNSSPTADWFFIGNEKPTMLYKTKKGFKLI